MTDKHDEESRVERRLTRAATKTVERATRVMSEESKSLQIAQQLEKQKKFGDRSPVHLNVLLNALSKSENRRVAEKGLGGYLSAKLDNILKKLLDPTKNQNIPDVEIRNLAILIRMSESLHNNFIEALKSINSEGNGVVFSKLIQNGIFNHFRDRDFLQNLAENKKLGDSAKPIMMLLKVNDFIVKKEGNVGEIEKLAEDVHARAVLVHELKSKSYVNEIDQLEKILQSGALKESELFDLLIFYRKNRDTYGDMPVEAITAKLRDNPQEYSSQVENRIANIEHAAKVSEMDSFGKIVADELLTPLQGIGLKGEKGGRWAAVTNNVFDEQGMEEMSARDLVVKTGEGFGLWSRSEDLKISKVNLARALNPFVLLDVGLLLAELGIQRATHAIPNKIVRGIIQSPIAVLLRAPRVVFNFLGRITSPAPLEIDVNKESKKKVTANEPSDSETVSREDTESVNSSLSALSSVDDEALSRGASRDYEANPSSKVEEKSRMTEEIRAPNTRIIADSSAGTIVQVEKEIKASVDKYSIQNFDLSKAKTEYAIRNMMSHTVFKENVTTDYDSTIIQLILNQKTDDPRFNNRAVEAMALRNALAERERLVEKTPADEVAIELLRVRLNNAINNMESLQEEIKMTDTTRVTSREEAASESDATFNLAGMEAKAGRAEGFGASTDSEEAEISPRSEDTTLLHEEKAQEATSLLGRLRQRLVGMFGGAGAETKTEPKVGEYEYNQVVLKGFAGKIDDDLGGFKKWVDSHQEALGGVKGIQEVNGKVEVKFPIEFGNGQRIERSNEGDLIMKGFSAEAYMGFNKKMFSEPPAITISASNGKSIKAIAHSLEGVNTPTFMSRLNSIGLFFQQMGSTIKSFFTGSPATTGTATAVKSETAPHNVEQKSEMSSVKTEPRPTPGVTVDQNRSSVPPVAVSVEPKPERRQITSAPAKINPAWVSRAKVTVAIKNDLDTTKSTVEHYASTHGFRDVQTEQKSGQSIKINLEDHQGGRLSVSAVQGKPEVNIEELKRSSESPTHMNNIATELPNPGPKNVTVSGRASLQVDVLKALDVGKHNVNPTKEQHAENKENITPTKNH